MFQCKYCGESLPDPEPKVIVKEINVQRWVDEDNRFYVTLAKLVVLVLVALIITAGSTCAYKTYLTTKVIKDVMKDPNSKFEYRDGANIPEELKITK